MSDLELSFLQQIASQPHDWQPRLIFADWLEEQGDPRGELIRLSHQLTRLDCQDRQTKETRLQALSAAGVVWPSPSLPNSLGIKFILIPPGQFRMGSPESEPERGADENQVDVTHSRGFWLGQYPVTEAEYELVMGHGSGNIFGKPQDVDLSRHPATLVRWSVAEFFCSRLTEQERVAGRLPADWLYTLPTEAQWEYACRAGTTTRFSFGDDASRLPQYAWFSETASEPAEKYAQPVGQKQPNAWNLYDMHGNVAEWCLDPYRDQLPGGTDPFVQERDQYLVYRGGGWGAAGNGCRSAARRWARYDQGYTSLGFRLAAVQVR